MSSQLLHPMGDSLLSSKPMLMSINPAAAMIAQSSAAKCFAMIQRDHARNTINGMIKEVTTIRMTVM
jgi:hypothetical protein